MKAGKYWLLFTALRRWKDWKDVEIQSTQGGNGMARSGDIDNIRTIRTGIMVVVQSSQWQGSTQPLTFPPSKVARVFATSLNRTTVANTIPPSSRLLPTTMMCVCATFHSSYALSLHTTHAPSSIPVTFHFTISKPKNSKPNCILCPVQCLPNSFLWQQDQLKKVGRTRALTPTTTMTIKTWPKMSLTFAVIMSHYFNGFSSVSSHHRRLHFSNADAGAVFLTIHPQRDIQHGCVEEKWL